MRRAPIHAAAAANRCFPPSLSMTAALEVSGMPPPPPAQQPSCANGVASVAGCKGPFRCCRLRKPEGLLGKTFMTLKVFQEEAQISRPDYTIVGWLALDWGPSPLVLGGH